jgi:hypothetical protein
LNIYSPQVLGDLAVEDVRLLVVKEQYLKLERFAALFLVLYLQELFSKLHNHPSFQAALGAR